MVYLKMDKEEDSDWFVIEINEDGTDWNGKGELKKVNRSDCNRNDREHNRALVA